MKAILAGNYREAENFAKEKIWNKQEWIYITRPEILLGLSNIELHKTGTWHKRKDLVEIYEIVERILNYSIPQEVNYIESLGENCCCIKTRVDIRSQIHTVVKFKNTPTPAEVQKLIERGNKILDKRLNINPDEV